MDWRVPIVGMFVGLMMGVTGIGAGTFTMPLLVLWVGVPPLSAVGSNVVYSALTNVVGGWQHARLGTVDYRMVRRLAAASVPASILGAWWISSVQVVARQEAVVSRVVGGSLIAAALVLAAQALLRRSGAAGAAQPSGWVLGPAGAILGGVVGATSVGSGSFGTAILSFTTRLPGRRIVGTVSVHAAVLMLAGALTHLSVGTVRPELVGGLLLGSLPGVALGSRLTVRIPEPVLRGVLALLLLGLGVRMQLPRTPAAENASAAHDTVPGPAGPRRVPAEPPPVAPGPGSRS